MTVLLQTGLLTPEKGRELFDEACRLGNDYLACALIRSGFLQISLIKIRKG